MAIDVVVYDRRFLDLVDPNQDYVRIASGLTLGEGPVWHEGLRSLIFNDIPASKTYMYNERDGLRLLFDNGSKANGMWVDPEGWLLMCEHATSRLVRRSPDGRTVEVLADHYGDIELNSPNDVVQRSDGLIYFSDPIYGRLDKPASVPRPFPSDLRPVYRYDPCTKRLSLAAAGFENPNGLCFSPDERVLYVNDSPTCRILAFDVTGDGMLTHERLVARTQGEGGPPDGMKVDEFGNIVCAAQQGLHWLTPEGEYLGVIIEPERLLNFTWGDDDFQTLYIACATGAYRFRTLARGCRYGRKTTPGAGRRRASRKEQNHE